MAKGKSESVSSNVELVESLRQAIELTRPTVKKTISTRTKSGPWAPKDGSPKLKLKRIMYQHGLKIEEDRVSNQEIELLNKVKPGVYCDGNVRVVRRKDRGVNIEYSVKTASNRLKLINDYGITSLTALCQKLIDESAQPKKIENEDVDE